MREIPQSFPELVELGKTETERLHHSILKTVVTIDFEDLEELHEGGHNPEELSGLARDLFNAVKDTGILHRTEKLQYVEQGVRQRIRKLKTQMPTANQSDLEVAMAV